MPRLSLRRSPGRGPGARRAAAAAFACAIFALAAGLAAPAASASGPVDPATVAARLGANNVPAEIVILVDVSGSMTADGLYPQVQQELPSFLGRLKQQDPQDIVAVVVFGTPRDTQTVYFGSPTADITLPATATSADTDFGYAFQQALGILSQAKARIKIGGVLLMSDGELDAPDDPQYATYSAPGWAKLRTMEQGLAMAVTGYGLPLSPNQAYIDSVNTALGQVFSQRQTLTSDLGDIGAQLNLASGRIMDSRVASAAGPDSGRGVRVTWVGLPGSVGASALDLGAGHAEVKVKLTSTTSLIPLTVVGLSVTSDGFPTPVHGSLPGGSIQLAPGRSVTVPVQLSWRPASGGMSLFGGSQSVQGRLALAGQVTSPFDAAIRDTFGDRAFRVGGLTGDTSANALATVPGQSAVVVWVIIILLLLAAAAGLVIWCARLQGRLILSPPQKPAIDLILPRRPWLVRPTEGLIRVPGRITVRRLHGQEMRITLRLNGSVSRGVLRPGGRTWVAGIGIDHRPEHDTGGVRQHNFGPEPR